MTEQQNDHKEQIDPVDEDIDEEDAFQRELEQKLLIAEGLQKSVQFELRVMKGQKNEASFADYIEQEDFNKKKLRLKLEIDSQVKDLKDSSIYNTYFNFGLNTTTWRQVVNK